MMIYIRIFLCVGAGILLPLHLKIGEARYSALGLESEIDAIPQRAIVRLSLRFLMPLFSLLYGLAWLLAMRIFEPNDPYHGMVLLLFISLTTGYLHWARHQFGDPEQEVFSMGYSPILAFILNAIKKHAIAYNEHLSNLFDVFLWTTLSIILLWSNLIIFGLMIFLSALCLGIVAINHYAIDTENKREREKAKQLDNKLNGTSVKTNISTKDEKKDEDIFSKPF